MPGKRPIKQPPVYHYEADWMDSGLNPDASLSDPSFRISCRKTADPSRPVLICAHGFSASTWEWEEFREYAQAGSPLLVSNVLLGGHGRSVIAFGQSTWQDWGKPLLEEYQALVRLGYRKISLAGSSTGATLLLYYLLQGAFGNAPAPQHLFCIDPFLIATGKVFYLTPLVSLFVKNVAYLKFSAEERRHFHVNRPVAAIRELYKLVTKTCRLIRRKPVLGVPARLIVYKSRFDKTAHLKSAQLLERCLTEHDGRKPEIVVIDSDKHGLIRSRGRRRWSEQDRQWQLQIFDAIVEKCTK